jgi:hypothetical protein
VSKLSSLYLQIQHSFQMQTLIKVRATFLDYTFLVQQTLHQSKLAWITIKSISNFVKPTHPNTSSCKSADYTASEFFQNSLVLSWCLRFKNNEENHFFLLQQYLRKLSDLPSWTLSNLRSFNCLFCSWKYFLTARLLKSRWYILSFFSNGVTILNMS